LTKAEQASPPRHYLDWSLKGKPALWRYSIAFLIAMFIWVVGAIPEMMLFGELVANPRTGPITMLYSFLPGLFGIFVVVRLLLGRPAYSVFSPAWPPRWVDYGIGILFGYLISGALVLASVPFVGTTYQGFGLERDLGLSLILLMIVGFVIQTAFEELLFRGLLMQFARRITSWLPFVFLAPALLFAIPHFGNVSAWTSSGLIAVLPYIIVAVSWAWVVWRTGSLLMSMGLHFANNSFNALASGVKGDIIVPYAPIIQEMPPLPLVLALTLAQAALTLIAIELWMRRVERREQAARGS
jgi:membrane protease YdiL (CAAX protease family)